MTRKELNLRETAVVYAYLKNNISTALDCIMELRDRNTDKKLYRFRPPKMYEIDAIQKEKIYLCRPSQYTDSDDCKIEYDIPDLYEYYLRNIKYPKHKNDLCFIDDHAMKQLIKKIEANSDFQQVSERMRNECLVACISGTFNTYMWEHYAQNNEGICLEYDMDNIITNTKFPLRFLPIRYVESRQKTDDIKFNSLDFNNTDAAYKNAAKKYMASCLTKNKIPYAQEHEWRLIYDHCSLDNGKEGLLFDFILPSKIILGKNIFNNPNFANSIIECAKNKGIPIENQ